MKRSSFLMLVLGVLLGAGVVMTANRLSENRRLLKVQYSDWRKLNLILQTVDENYVDEVDREKVTEAAVSAALQALDPHSMYMPPRRLEETEEDLAGNFSGIGIQFNVPNDTAVVIEVIPGGPAEKLGMQPGDRLLKVDDKVIAGVKFPQDSMVRRMKGPAGTKVTVTVKRGSDVIPFEIVRGRIPLHSVDASFMVNDTTGYLRVSKFALNTYTEVINALSGLRKQGMRRLVLDLRDNSGGFMQQAVLLTNEFLHRGDTIVYLEGLHRPREDYRADGRGSLSELPLVILINEGTASASEILAGAIQDNDAGILVGRRSFGKGLVQEPIDFTDGSGIRITVARYYTPSGRCIQKPYDDYGHDLYDRYRDGEIFSADSAKINREDVHYTVSGRPVYGGGGIMPDVYVPMDTTRATGFFVACNRKTTQMRFASAVFDRYAPRLREIDSFEAMDRFFTQVNLKDQFLTFAREKDGLRCSEEDWKKTEPYLMPQLRALVARYSKLGDNAFYKYYLPVDETVKVALQQP